MNHTQMIIALAITTALSAGCDKASDEQAKATNSQIEANTKINAAKDEAAAKGNAAQAEADKAIGEANASFMKMREDYRHKTTENLVDIDRKVGVLETKSRAATGRVQADDEASLVVIRNKRGEFSTDYRAIDSAGASTWDATKARLDRELGDLTAMIDKR